MGSLPFLTGANDNVGQFYCQQILPFIQLKNFSNCSGPFTALGNPFVPGSASSPSVLRTCFEFSQFSSHPPFHLYFPHAIDDLPWDILTSQEVSAGWISLPLPNSWHECPKFQTLSYQWFLILAACQNHLGALNKDAQTNETRTSEGKGGSQILVLFLFGTGIIKALRWFWDRKGVGHYLQKNDRAVEGTT